LRILARRSRERHRGDGVFDQNGSCAVYNPHARIITDEPICHVDVEHGPTFGTCDYLASCPATGGPFSVVCSPEPVCLLDAQHSPFAIVVSNPDRDHAVTVTLSNRARV
jgi:hypothetical protein